MVISLHHAHVYGRPGEEAVVWAFSGEALGSREIALDEG